MSPFRLRGGEESGAAALETALVMPGFLILIFAILAFGLRVLAEGYATQKSRETVRYATIVYTPPIGSMGVALNPGTANTDYPKQALLLNYAESVFQNDGLAQVTDVEFAPNSAPCLSQINTGVYVPNHGQAVTLIVTAKINALASVPLIPAFARTPLSTITTTVQAVCE